MNITRDGLIIGLLLGVVLGGGIWTYPIYLKTSALENQIEELEDQLNDQQDLTEFQREVQYYQIHGVVLEYVHWAFNGTIGHPIETMIYYPEYYSEVYPNRTISIIQVSKTELREEVWKKFGPINIAGSITVNFPEETLYFIKSGYWKPDELDVQLLWWSPRMEG